MNTTGIGRTGEQLAVSYLKKLGCKVVCQNYRAGHGEIDIIAKDGKTLVFYEVKSRTPASVFKYGSGRYALDARKKAAFISAVKMYLYKNAIQSPVRIDVIEISFKGDTFFEYDLKHFKNAF